MAQYFDDFSGNSDGASPSGWTLSDAATITSAVRTRASEGNRALQFDVGVVQSLEYWEWDTPGALTDQKGLACGAHYQIDDVNQTNRLVVRIAGYWLYISTIDYRLYDGSNSPLGTATSFPEKVIPGRRIYARWEVSGTTINFRVWLDRLADEPGSWSSLTISPSATTHALGVRDMFGNHALWHFASVATGADEPQEPATEFGLNGTLLVMTEDTGNAAITNTLPILRAWAQANDYTVGILDDAGAQHAVINYRTAALSTAGLLVPFRTSNNDNQATYLRGAIDAGVPALIGYPLGLTAGGAAGSVLSTAMYLTGNVQVTASNNATEIDITDNAHPITTGLSLGRLAINANALIQPAIVGSTIGDVLADGDPDVSPAAGNPVLIAIEAGTSDLQGSPVPVGARVVILTPLHFGNTGGPTADGIDLVERCLDWLTQTPVAAPTATLDFENVTHESAEVVVGYSQPDSEPQAVMYLELYDASVEGWGYDPDTETTSGFLGAIWVEDLDVTGQGTAGHWGVIIWDSEWAEYLSWTEFDKTSYPDWLERYPWDEEEPGSELSLAPVSDYGAEVYAAAWDPSQSGDARYVWSGVVKDSFTTLPEPGDPATFVTTFGEYTAGSLLKSQGWTEFYAGSEPTSIYTAVANTSAICGRVMRRAPGPGASSTVDDILCNLEEIPVTSQQIVARVILFVQSTTLRQGSAAVRVNSVGCYTASLVGLGTLRLERFDSIPDTRTTLGSDFTLPVALTVGSRVVIEAEAAGDTIRARAYPYGESPPAWQVEETDATYSAGSAGMGSRGTLTENYDAFFAATEGASLPALPECCPNPGPIAGFDYVASGLSIQVTSTAQSGDPGATISSYAYELLDDEESVIATSSAANPIFNVPEGGTYTITQEVESSLNPCIGPDDTEASVTVGVGSTFPPYELPTERVAGKFLIALDSSRDWSEIPGVVFSTEGRPFLDYSRLPTPTGGTQDRVLIRRIEDGADLDVRRLNATLHLVEASGSLSSGAVDSWINNLTGSFSPVIMGRRMILVQDQISGADGSTDPDDYSPRFHGYVDRHPASSSGELQIFARDCASWLMIPYTGEPVWIGVEGSALPLNEAIQRVLDAATEPGLWRLKTVGTDLEWAIPAFQLTQVPSVLNLIRSMAQQRNAVVRWWPDSDTGRFQLTLFILQEDKSSPDITFGPGATEEIAEHDSDTTNLRNDITLWFFPAGQTEPVKIHRGATAAEKKEFGFIPLVIGTQSTAQIKDAVAANVMLDGVETALRTPATIGARKVPRNRLIEVNSLLRFEADGRVCQEDIDLYVTKWTEEQAVAGNAYTNHTTAELRAAPVGRLAAWYQSFQEHAQGIPGGGNAPPVEQEEQPLPPVFSVRTAANTLWFKIHRLGLQVSNILGQQKKPGENWSELAAPTRGFGANSLVNGGKLGVDEYEIDGELVGDALTGIRAECRVETIEKPVLIALVFVDGNLRPTFRRCEAENLDVVVEADSDTLSIEAEKLSGPGDPWDDAVDGNEHRFEDLPVPLGEEWQVRVRIYNTLIDDRGDPGELMDERVITVRNDPPDPEVGYVRWLGDVEVDLFEPEEGSGVATLALQASAAPPGYTVRIFRRYQLSTGFPTPWEDITSTLNPPPFAVPTTLTTYEVPTPYVRNDASGSLLYMWIRAELRGPDGLEPTSEFQKSTFVKAWLYNA